MPHIGGRCRSVCRFVLNNYRTNQSQVTEKLSDNNPNYRKIACQTTEKISFQVIEHELVNEIFEPFEQVSQVQAQLLGATFEMLSGGPSQTHVGTGGGGSSPDMPWGERKKDNNTSRRRR